MFLLQVVHTDGTPVRFAAGEQVELDLRVALRTALAQRQRYVGKLSDEDIDAALADAFERFKAQVVPGKVV